MQLVLSIAFWPSSPTGPGRNTAPDSKSFSVPRHLCLFQERIQTDNQCFIDTRKITHFTEYNLLWREVTLSLSSVYHFVGVLIKVKSILVRRDCWKQRTTCWNLSTICLCSLHGLMRPVHGDCEVYHLAC